MGFSAHQLRILELNAKCSGSLSILGSSSLIYEILKKRRKRDRTITVLNQILLGMSSFDIGASTMYVVGSWAIPKGTGGNIFQPSGTDATCTAQGFLFQTFASAIPSYNLSLAIYYYVTINHSWREEKLRRYWWMFHLLPFCFGSSTATYGVVTGQFNPNELWCWFSGTEQSDLLKFLFYYGPLWVVFFVIVILFILMYRRVRNQEKANIRYSFAQQILNVAEPNNSTNMVVHGAAVAAATEATNDELSSSIRRRLSRPVFIQGLLFSIVFIITFFFPTLFRAQQLHKDNIRFGVPIMMTVFLPMQGFLNFLVFKRLDIQKFFMELERPNWCGTAKWCVLDLIWKNGKGEQQQSPSTHHHHHPQGKRKSILPPTMDDVSMAFQARAELLQSQKERSKERLQPQHEQSENERNESTADVSMDDFELGNDETGYDYNHDYDKNQEHRKNCNDANPNGNDDDENVNKNACDDGKTDNHLVLDHHINHHHDANEHRKEPGGT